VSSKKDTDLTRKPETGISRRGFIRGIGIGGGAVGTGILQTEAEAAPPAANVAGPGEVPITLQINGKPVKLMVEPRMTLLDVLRNNLELTGAKRVCDRGTCGACTVIMSGKVVYACNLLAIDVQGKPIQTIEGLSTGAGPHPVQAAFVNHDAQQCGFCTPGFVMAVTDFLEKHPNPTYEQVKDGLGGNICRCGTYMGIRGAALEAARTMRGAKNA
jgi:xanthine dehydrogenase YagT iron-sulfur-binding subunit